MERRTTNEIRMIFKTGLFFFVGLTSAFIVALCQWVVTAQVINDEENRGNSTPIS
jgi:predicted RND superfamily exporter protein